MSQIILKSLESNLKIWLLQQPSYIASFVLGVRDRHYDNVLIKNDGTSFMYINLFYVVHLTLWILQKLQLLQI